MCGSDFQRRADQRQATEQASQEKAITEALDLIAACVEYHSLPAILKEAGRLILEKHSYAEDNMGRNAIRLRRTSRDENQ